MSNSEVTKHITKPLLKTLEQKAQDKTRAAVQGQTGQLLILRNISVFREIISSSLGIDLTKSTETKALAAGRTAAKKLQSGFKQKNKLRFNTIARRLPDVLPPNIYTLGENVFIVTSFASSITKVKDAIFNALIASGEITAEQSSDIRGQIHRGHGVRGTAVSQVGIARSMSKMGGLFGQGSSQRLLQDNLKAFIQKGNVDLKRVHELESLVINYNQIVTNTGKLRAQYFSIIDFQAGAENIGVDSQLEKALVKTFRDYIKFISPKLGSIKGSSTLTEKVEKSLVKAVAGKPQKNKKVTTSTKKYSASSKGRSKVTQKKGRAKITLATVKAIKKARNTAKGVSASPLALITAINKALPQTIRANMGSPMLNYRTGRFAESVKVLNITTPKRGYPTIDYTYQHDPYQVFELGNGPLATRQRDPRKIIDETIREIAAAAAFRKFHTRRV